jgi:hypothetical protein
VQALSGEGGLLYMEKQIHGGNIFDKDILLDYSVKKHEDNKYLIKNIMEVQ